MNLPGIGNRLERDVNGVRGAISRAAQRVGVDFTYLLNQAKSESGLNPNAQAQTSSAGGLFQFIDQSWLGAVKLHGAKHGLGWAADAISRRGGSWKVDESLREQVMALRNNPEASSLMAAEFASDNKDALRTALGREPRPADLYFAHFLGAEGATRFLRATDTRPDMSAAALFPREARANRTIFYNGGGNARSLSEVYALMAKKIDDDGSRPAPVPASILPSDELRLAYARQVFESDGKAAPDTGEMLAMMGSTSRFNLLKPNPGNAMLAYMMLASDGDSSISDNDSLNRDA
jgi:hypothetical protein